MDVGIQVISKHRADPTIDSSVAAGLILGLRPANERRRYFVTTSPIGWAQAKNQPCSSSRMCNI